MYPTDLQDLLPSDCYGSSEEGEDSDEDTGEGTYVDEGDAEKWQTAPFRILLCAR